MLEDNEIIESKENVELVQNNDRGCDNCCCDKKPLPNIPMYNYNFTNTAAEDDNCEEKMETRKELLDKIRSLDFAIVELAEYLDTHPDDEKALCLHREYANDLHDLKNKYQKVYGPLDIKFPCNKWRWIEGPWPWERSGF